MDPLFADTVVMRHREKLFTVASAFHTENNNYFFICFLWVCINLNSLYFIDKEASWSHIWIQYQYLILPARNCSIRLTSFNEQI